MEWPTEKEQKKNLQNTENRRELMCSGRESSSCFMYDTHRVCVSYKPRDNTSNLEGKTFGLYGWQLILLHTIQIILMDNVP